MAKLFGKTVTKKTLASKVCNLNQVAGFKRTVLAEGAGKGSEMVELTTGGGLEFTVSLDRGMDITHARYKGIPLGWISPTGDCHPSRFTDRGLDWLRSFPGGMVTTCGLTQAGAPCVDDGVELGLHGRYTSLPAANISQTSEWQGSDLVFRLSGEMREAVLFGENILMRREITANLGEASFAIKDTVTNEGSQKSPHMLLYHCNFGYPLLDEGTVLETPAKEVEPRDVEAEEGREEALRFAPPKTGYNEKVYFHKMKTDRKGFVKARLRNPNLLGGLSVSVKYKLDQLPYFTQWKMLGKGEYVCGLEPANCLVLGRAEERKAGRLANLKPGETREYELEFCVEEGTTS